MKANCWNDAGDYDFNALVDALNRYLRLKATPIGLKRFRTVEEMAAVPKIRRPPAGEKFAFDQMVGQSRWLGWSANTTPAWQVMMGRRPTSEVQRVSEFRPRASLPSRFKMAAI